MKEQNNCIKCYYDKQGNKVCEIIGNVVITDSISLDNNGTLKIDGNVKIIGKFPIRAYGELSIIGTQGSTLIVEATGDYQPAIGLETRPNNVASSIDYALGYGILLKRIELRDIKVELISKVVNFSMGTFGYNAVPIIHLKNSELYSSEYINGKYIDIDMFITGDKMKACNYKYCTRPNERYNNDECSDNVSTKETIPNADAIPMVNDASMKNNISMDKDEQEIINDFIDLLCKYDICIKKNISMKNLMETFNTAGVPSLVIKNINKASLMSKIKDKKLTKNVIDVVSKWYEDSIDITGFLVDNITDVCAKYIGALDNTYIAEEVIKKFVSQNYNVSDECVIKTRVKEIIINKFGKDDFINICNNLESIGITIDDLSDTAKNKVYDRILCKIYKKYNVNQNIDILLYVVMSDADVYGFDITKVKTYYDK